MGGISSKNNAESQLKKNEILKELELSKEIAANICKESMESLTKLFDEVNTIVQQNSTDGKKGIFNLSLIEQIHKNYSKALTIVDCHSEESSLFKAKILFIYQNYIKDVALYISNNLNNLSIELEQALKDMEEGSKKDTPNGEVKKNQNVLQYGPYMDERLTLFNNGISNLEKLNTFYVYDDEYISGFLEYYTEIYNKINTVYSKYGGTYDLYKKCLMTKYYAIGIIPPTRDMKKIELDLKSNLSIIQEYFNIEVYKYLLKFSELVPILYPIWKLSNSGQFVEITDMSAFYKWAEEKQYFNVNTVDVQQNFINLMAYYALEVMNKTIPGQESLTWFAYFGELFSNLEQSILNQKITSEEELFRETKIIYKLLGINHWKSIKFYANLNLDKVNQTEQLFIPSNYPVFSPKLETLTTIIYSFNKLVEVYGRKEKKGGRYFKDPNILHYDEIFYEKYEEPTLIQVNQIGNTNNSSLSNDQKIFAKRLNYYNEICDNTLGWYSYVINESSIASTIVNSKPISYLELFNSHIRNKFQNVTIEENLDFESRFKEMNKQFTTVSNTNLNLNTSYFKDFKTDIRDLSKYIDSQNNLKSYENTTTQTLILELDSPDLNSSPTDISSDNLLTFYSESEEQELKDLKSSETQDMFGFLSAAYICEDKSDIPNVLLIFKLLAESLNSKEIELNNPLYNKVNSILFNYSDYMTYPLATDITVSVSKLVNCIYTNIIIKNKNFAMIIPLYPTDMLNNKEYYNTINYKDYKTCIENSNILKNNGNIKYDTNSDELKFDNMLQRCTFYRKSDGSF